MSYILYSPATSTTGRALAGRLNIRGGTVPPSNKEDFIIRWGSTTHLPVPPRHVINKLASVSLAADKLKSWQVLWETDITTPEIVTAEKANELRGYIKLPALGRRTRSEEHT